MRAGWPQRLVEFSDGNGEAYAIKHLPADELLKHLATPNADVAADAA